MVARDPTSQVGLSSAAGPRVEGPAAMLGATPADPASAKPTGRILPALDVPRPAPEPTPRPKRQRATRTAAEPGNASAAPEPATAPLEAATCECYGAVKRRFAELLGSSPPSSSSAAATGRGARGGMMSGT